MVQNYMILQNKNKLKHKKVSEKKTFHILSKQSENIKSL